MKFFDHTQTACYKHKKIRKKGFFLYEVLISLMLAAFIMLMCTTMLLSLHRHVSRLNALCSSSLKSSGAALVAMRELAHAPCAISSWKKCEHTAAVWNNGAIDTGIHITNGSLVCYRGTYNAAKREWVSKTQSTLLENARGLTFDYQKKDGRITGVCFSFTCDNKTTEATVMCENGIILTNVTRPLEEKT